MHKRKIVPHIVTSLIAPTRASDYVFELTEPYIRNIDRQKVTPVIL